MKIYPAIDLMSGQCVRLIQGNFAAKKIYSNSPLDMIKYFEEQGCEYLHIVDLDGARQGHLQQLPLLKTILKQTRLKVQIGGGIRYAETIKMLLDAGADRVIIGSLAVTKKEVVIEWIERFDRNKIVLAFDVRVKETTLEPQVAISGWQKIESISLWEILSFYQNYGPIEILCTDIDRDGLMQGANFALYNECSKRYPNFSFLASGGIKTKEEITQLAKLKQLGGVILGKSLYENTLSLEEIIKW